MKKYLYLTRSEWANAWVNGGKIPLNLASTYKRMERSGIYTPDENVIDSSTHDISRLSPAIGVFGPVKNVTFGSITVDGVLIAQNVELNRHEEDGLILSLCNKKSKAIAKRLGKVACVKILDLNRLKEILDRQLDCVSISQNCEYTTNHNRNHFLKSVEDDWQDEHRLFWNYKKSVEVYLPAGLAKKIKL